MSIYSVLIVFVTTVLSSSYAFSTPVQSQLMNTASALQTFISHRNLPEINVAPNLTLKSSTATLPADVHQTFSSIQKTIFGRTDLISLQACEGCRAVADGATMSVNIDPEFLDEIRADSGSDADLIIKLIVAHEISHFTYDYIILNSKDGLSPNGNIPLMTKSFSDFVDLNQISKLSLDEQLTEVSKYMKRASTAHAEVDTLAILSLKMMGIDVISQAKRYMSATILKESGMAKEDFQARRDMLETLFPENEIGH